MLELERVLDGERLPVVVEVGVHVHVLTPLADARGPLVELGLRIVAATTAMPVVEADEGPLGGDLVGLELALGRVADHERDAVPPQQLVDVLAEPARVAELEAVAALRQLLERLC